MSPDFPDDPCTPSLTGHWQLLALRKLNAMELWENAFFQPFLETDHYLYLLTLSVRTDTICTLQRVKLLTKSLSVRDYTICTPQHNMYAEVC